MGTFLDNADQPHTIRLLRPGRERLCRGRAASTVINFRRLIRPPEPISIADWSRGVCAPDPRHAGYRTGGDESAPVFHNPLRCRPSPPRSIVGHERQNSKRANGSAFSAGSDLALTRLWLRRRIARLVPDTHQPVVRTHPETGRPSLLLSPRFTLGIDGVTQARSDALLHEIFALIARIRISLFPVRGAAMIDC